MEQIRGNAGRDAENQTGSRITVSVIIPTLNEAQNLPLVLPFIPLDAVDEVILVDGQSKDGTVNVARQLLPSIRVVSEPRPGKGLALRKGYETATGDILIVIDADGSHDPREIPRFVRALLEGADFVKGSRFAPQGGTTDMPRIRKLGNGAFVKIINLLFDTTFTDICYGFHAFWRYCLDVIDTADVDGFEIDTAVYLQAVRNRLRIIDVPSFEGYRFYGIGKLKTIPDGWRVLKTILNEWMKSLREEPKEPQRLFRGLLPDRRPVSELNPWNAFRIGRVIVNPLEQRFEQLKIFLKLLSIDSQEQSEEINLQILLEHILRLAMESIGAVRGSIVLLDEKGHIIEQCLILRGQTAQLSDANLGEVVEKGLAGWVFKSQRPALVQSTREDSRWLRRPWEDRDSISRSALGVPLRTNDRVVGVMTMIGNETQPFTEDDLMRISSVLTHG